MSSYSTVEHFLSELMIRYYQNIPVPRGIYYELAKLKVSKRTRTMCSTLERFCDAFCSEFHQVFAKRCSEVQHKEEEFMTYVIPRCLKLCEKQNHFTFMLVCAFIAEFLDSFAYDRENCFRFVGTGIKSLIAVFKRRFENLLDDGKEWDSLEVFCRNVNKTVSMRKFGTYLQDGLCLYLESKSFVLDLISKCDNIDDSFSLNDYELSLISDNEQIENEFVPSTEHNTAHRNSNPDLNSIVPSNSEIEEYAAANSEAPKTSKIVTNSCISNKRHSIRLRRDRSSRSESEDSSNAVSEAQPIEPDYGSDTSIGELNTDLENVFEVYTDSDSEVSENESGCSSDASSNSSNSSWFSVLEMEFQGFDLQSEDFKYSTRFCLYCRSYCYKYLKECIIQYKKYRANTTEDSISDVSNETGTST